MSGILYKKESFVRTRVQTWNLPQSEIRFMKAKVDQ